MHYDSVSYDMDKFNLETKRAILKIVKYVSRLCNMMLAKGIESNERLESKKHEDIVDKKTLIDNDENKSKAIAVEKTIDDIMIIYSEIQKLMEKRKKLNEQKKILYDKASELQKELDDVDSRLEELLRDSR